MSVTPAHPSVSWYPPGVLDTVREHVRRYLPLEIRVRVRLAHVSHSCGEYAYACTCKTLSTLRGRACARVYARVRASGTCGREVEDGAKGGWYLVGGREIRAGHEALPEARVHADRAATEKDRGRGWRGRDRAWPGVAPPVRTPFSLCSLKN